MFFPLASFDIHWFSADFLFLPSNGGLSQQQLGCCQQDVGFLQPWHWVGRSESMLPCLSAATQHTLLFISPPVGLCCHVSLQSYSENQVAAPSRRLSFCMQTTSCTQSHAGVFFSFHSSLWKVCARFSVCYCQCLPSLFIIIISVENIFLGRVFADPYPSFTAPEYTHLIKDSVVKSTAWELIFKLCLWLHGWPWVGWLDPKSFLELTFELGGSCRWIRCCRRGFYIPSCF